MEYNFKEVEKKWQSYWKENQTYKVDVDPSKPKFYVLDMFPYPSGLLSLTVCHPATVRDKDLLYTATGKTYRKSNISSRNSLPAALSA